MSSNQVSIEELERLKEEFENSAKYFIDLSKVQMHDLNKGFFASPEELLPTQVVTRHTVKNANEVLHSHTRAFYNTHEKFNSAKQAAPATSGIVTPKAPKDLIKRFSFFGASKKSTQVVEPKETVEQDKSSENTKGSKSR